MVSLIINSIILYITVSKTYRSVIPHITLIYVWPLYMLPSHCDGRIPSFIDLLYNIDNGWLNSLDNSLRKYGCQLSGPGDLPGSKLFNLFNITSSETWSVSKLSPVKIYFISGILAKSLSTKILLKKLFNDSAFYLSETANVPSGLFNVGSLALIFNF